MSKYFCTVCNWIYDQKFGVPQNGIVPGIAFDDLPEDFLCPICGVGKEEFEKEKA